MCASDIFNIECKSFSGSIVLFFREKGPTPTLVVEVHPPSEKWLEDKWDFREAIIDILIKNKSIPEGSYNLIPNVNYERSDSRKYFGALHDENGQDMLRGIAEKCGWKPPTVE